MVRLKAAALGAAGQLSLFQFHMVRLKVLQDHERPQIDEFQFHMVRLKEERPLSACPLFSGFNSIWYD